jgi:fumarylacetoacetate (FAA) hydrolase
MLGLLDLGPEALDRLRRAIDSFRHEHRDAILLPEEITAPRWLVELAAPVPRPRSFRDFYAYESHVAAAYNRRNRPVPSAWYETPVFFFQNAGSIHGPDEEIPFPQGSRQLDLELEIAAVIGKRGRDIQANDAWAHVAGLSILNDWSARDIQAMEMRVGLGPAKGKDFASSLGPALVTLDELEPWFRGDRHWLDASIMVNDDVIAETNTGEHYWSLPQMIAAASRQVELEPGDVIGFGTVGRGCILELGEEVHSWLEPGDEVILSVAGLGQLRNRIRSG